MPGPQDPKPLWRDWARARRAGLPDTSAAICASLAAFLRARGIGRVLAYRALPGEPDLAPLAADFELYTTRARFRPTPELTLHPWASATEPSRFGALQPPADAPQVGRERVQAVLLPGLAYDRRGVRLGYGGGFYDRLLAEWTPLTVGVTPWALLLPELPQGPHDRPVDHLATENGVWAAERPE